MSDTEGVRALTCPACGAQIHVAEGKSRTTCEYCGTLLELPHPSKPEAAPVILAGPTRPGPQRVKASPTRWGLVVLVLAVVMIGVIGLVTYFAVQGLGGGSLSGITSALSSLRVSTPALVVPGGPGGQLDALIYTRDSSTDTQFLSYVDGSSRTLRWQTGPLGEDSYRAALAVGDKLAFAVVKTRVMAFDRQSGEIAWEASVSDEVPYSCPNDCMRLVGDRIVVLTRDGRLAGFDSLTGRVVWTIRLNSTPDQMYVVGDRIAVFDNRDEGVVLSIIDPADGSQAESLAPKCTDPSSGFTDDPDLNSQVLVAPDQESLVVLFGFFSSCAQRWDVAAGSLLWNASLGDLAISHAFGASSAIMGDSIYAAADNQLVEIKLADGSWRVLINDPDYEFVPLAARNGILMVRAKRTRGTTRLELWGIDASTGDRAWEHPLPDSEPLDEPDRMSGLVDQGDSAWTAHLTSSGLVVVQAMAKPNQLTVETLNPETGVGGGAQAIPLSGISSDFYSAPEILGWPHGQLWLIVDGRIFVANLTQPGLDAVWP